MEMTMSDMNLQQALQWADINTIDPVVIDRLRSRKVVKILAETVRAYTEKAEQKHKVIEQSAQIVRLENIVKSEANIIEKQAAEIKALRSTLNRIVDCGLFTDVEAYNLGLIDENWKPSILLTGVKE